MVIERRSARNIRDAFNEMLDTLYPQGYGEWLDPNLEAARIHREFLDNQRLRDELSRALQDSADLGVAVAVEQLAGVGLGFDWTLANVSARDWALAHTDEVLRQLAGTTQTGVGQAVARWVDNGETLDVLINDLGVYFSPQRAAMIAATEVTRAYAEGTVTGYRESGVVERLMWRTANDEKVCPICGAMHNKVVGINARFDTEIPADVRKRFPNVTFQRPPAHPNCRCWIVAEV